MLHGLLIPADRGGPFGHSTLSDLSRAEGEGAAPGTEFRFHTAIESSPVGSQRTAWPRRRRLFTWLAIALLGVGIWQTSGAVYIHAKALVGQYLLQRAWNETRNSGQAVKPWPWADTYPLARLVAPRQQVELMVLAGASGRTLAWGPGHLDDSAAPGEAGNSVLSAHRDTHFRFLERLAPGDPLIVETAGGERRHYRVSAAEVANVRALRIPRDTARPRLTLVTCYPFDAVVPGGPLRYVVTADAT